MQLSDEVRSLLLKLGETPEKFHRKNHFHVDVQRHPVDQKTMKKNASQMLDSFLYMQEDLEQGNGLLLVLVLKRSGILSGR